MTKYRILVASEDTAHRWMELDEGSWDTVDQAIEFARAEVGVPWVVVDVCDAPYAFGDYTGKRGQVDPE